MKLLEERQTTLQNTGTSNKKLPKYDSNNPNLRPKFQQMTGIVLKSCCIAKEQSTEQITYEWENKLGSHSFDRSNTQN